jgi:hypothetical protein
MVQDIYFFSRVDSLGELNKYHSPEYLHTEKSDVLDIDNEVWLKMYYIGALLMYLHSVGID